MISNLSTIKAALLLKISEYFMLIFSYFPNSSILSKKYSVSVRILFVTVRNPVQVLKDYLLNEFVRWQFRRLCIDIQCSQFLGFLTLKSIKHRIKLSNCFCSCSFNIFCSRPSSVEVLIICYHPADQSPFYICIFFYD